MVKMRYENALRYSVTDGQTDRQTDERTQKNTLMKEAPVGRNELLRPTGAFIVGGMGFR